MHIYGAGISLLFIICVSSSKLLIRLFSSGMKTSTTRRWPVSWVFPPGPALSDTGFQGTHPTCHRQLLVTADKQEIKRYGMIKFKTGNYTFLHCFNFSICSTCLIWPTLNRTLRHVTVLGLNFFVKHLSDILVVFRSLSLSTCQWAFRILHCLTLHEFL